MAGGSGQGAIPAAQYQRPVIALSHHPEAVEVHRVLAVGNWQPAHRTIEGCRDPSLRHELLLAATDWRGRPGWLESWREGEPDSAVTWLVRGLHTVLWSWGARDVDVTAGQAAAAETARANRLRTAVQELRRAATLDPTDPLPWAYLLACARGLGAGPADWKNLFSQALTRDPYCYAAHLLMLPCLGPATGGSLEKQLDFVRQASLRAPVGSPIHGLVVEAHLEAWLYTSVGTPGSTEHLRLPAVRGEVDEAWRRRFQGVDRQAPAVVSDLNRFAFCYWLMQDAGQACDEFDALGPRLCEHPWRVFGEPLEVFKTARQSCGWPGRDVRVPVLRLPAPRLFADVVPGVTPWAGTTLELGQPLSRPSTIRAAGVHALGPSAEAQPVRDDDEYSQEGLTELARAHAALGELRRTLGEPPRRFSAEQEDHHRLWPPDWIRDGKGGGLEKQYTERRALMAEGMIVWGALIMANAVLFEPGPDDSAAGALVYSLDPHFDGNLHELRLVAHELYLLKETTPDDPAVRRLAHIITDEHEKRFNLAVPPSLTDGRKVLYTTIMIHRQHLPEESLVSGWFPIFAQPSRFTSVSIVPARHWPEDMRQQWVDDVINAIMP